MSRRLIAGALAVTAGAWWIGASGRVSAVERCAETSAFGFCIKWTTDGEDGDGGGDDDGNGDGTPSDGPDCWWESVSLDIGEDTPFLNDYGLSPPPEGAEVTWQTYVCSDGVERDQYRWVQRGPSAEELAQSARGRLAGVLPAPVIDVSPPLDVAAIVGVPTFVAIDNWTESMSESACAGGLCVTVTAQPSLWFAPGEAGTSEVACADGGSRHVAGADPFIEAALPGACVHAYQARTGVEGRPAAWPGSVWVEWTLAWSASDGQTGVLPDVVRSADLPRAVEEVQTVVVGGESP